MGFTAANPGPRFGFIEKPRVVLCCSSRVVELWSFGCKMNRRLLFVCSQNKLRSRTAEAVYSGYPGIEVDSAGLNHDAVVPLSAEQIEWADLILVMEQSHRNKLNKRFREHLAGKRVVVLGISDEYDYMDPALVELIKTRCAQFVS